MTREARSSSSHGDTVTRLDAYLVYTAKMEESKDVCYLAGDVEIFYHQFWPSAISATKAAAASCHPV